MALSRVPGDDELYVGGLFTLRRRNALSTTGITHIVSVLKYDFKEFEDWEKYEHLSIEVDDVEDENLLGEFERSGKWIENALKNGGKEGKGGKVLVHCAMGKSRSVTIVIAYLLRQYPNLNVKSALTLVRESRPIAEPNDGFIAQLELYKEMGCPRDIDLQTKYQRWVYQKEVNLALAAGMAPDKVRFEDEQTGEKGPIDGNEGKEVELRCRKCRRTLATTPYLVTHVPTAVTSPGLPPAPTHSACTHHFLHPLSWMRPALDQGLLNGRLECPNPKCLAQIGRYAWQGMRCSCGVWVCPAFSLQKGRVDEITKTKMGEGSQGQGSAGVRDGFRVAAVGAGAGESTTGGGGIRLPPGMRGKENL